MKKSIVWTIAGVDHSGYAGIAADLETLENLQINAHSVITAATTPAGIESMTADQIAAQIEKLSANFPPDAIKMGMSGDPSTYDTLRHFLENYSGPVVFDPVLESSAGMPLIFTSMHQHIDHLLHVFPLIDVLTPNTMEAEKILNCSLNSCQSIENAAQALVSLGAKSVLLKGGHTNDPLFSQDYWTNGIESFWLANLRLPEKNYRGTGCTLSSALAACLARGYSIKDAIVIAKMYVNRGIRKAIDITPSTAKLFRGGWPEDQEDLPYLSPEPVTQLPQPFKPCPPIGLYTIVDSSRWLEILLPQGVKTIQLRIKNDSSKNRLEQEIAQSISLAKKYHATLFINDYWELALHLGAEGIHLGQEDLQQADIEAIHHSGMLLGISTHCYYEVARAHAINPSYIACGPVYPTTSKIMPFQPQGIEQLHRWRRTLHYPLVAIGGITLERVPSILATQVNGIALISAITHASDPAFASQQFLTQINEFTRIRSRQTRDILRAATN